jgi:hypothetical protein
VLSNKPKDWATLSAEFNDLERRDNVTLVNHLDHNRSLTFGASLAPSERYGFDLNYGYTDVLCLAKTLSDKELNRESDVLTVKEPFESLTRLGLES